MSPEQVVDLLLDSLRESHERFRAVVRDLDAAALNWSPGPEINSLAVLVAHTLGSQRETLLICRGDAVARDREAEFRVRVQSADELLQWLDEADQRVQETRERLRGADLSRPVVIRGRSLTVLGGLLRTALHTREHLAHAELTRQWWQLSQQTAGRLV